MNAKENQEKTEEDERVDSIWKESIGATEKAARPGEDRIKNDCLRQHKAKAIYRMPAIDGVQGRNNSENYIPTMERKRKTTDSSSSRYVYCI